MKFLCLAYGLEADWLGLTRREQEELLAQDQVLRDRGGLVAALGEGATTVRSWDGPALATEGVFAVAPLPLVGFSVVEAADLDEAIRLVEGTPCARARGAIELRPIATMNVPAWASGEPASPARAGAPGEPAGPAASP
jgi:hypothetical protein